MATKGIKGTRATKGIRVPKGVKGPKVKAVVVAKPVPLPVKRPAPMPVQERAHSKIVIHHHHYPPRVPANRVVQGAGPNRRAVSTPAAPVANPMRPRPQAPTNSGLRFSGSPNAFRYGGGNRGPGQGGLI